MLSRRTLLEVLGLTPLFASGPFARVVAAGSKTQNVYDELGVRPLINCWGTATAIGASKQWPELHRDMVEAGRHFVIINELQDKVGERLARLIGCEAAMVTTGAAGAITLGTCACLTGTDTEKVRRLPDVTSLKNEVVIPKVKYNPYYHAVRNSGVRIVEVENKKQLVDAVNEKTAMMYFLGGSSGDWAFETPIPLEECLAVGKEMGFPVMVDAANMLPPWDNIRKLAALGTELICISGGKHMRGPQCSGILAGRADLIRAARLNSSPFPDSLGRPFKVGREEIIGIWRAAEKYAKLDFAALDRQCFLQAEYLKMELQKIPGLDVRYAPHDRTRTVHRVDVKWDEKVLGLTTRQCEQQLMDGNPRIAALRNDPQQGLLFVMFMNDPGDEKVIARRMKEIFAATRSHVS